MTTEPQGQISLDYAGDVVALEKLRLMYAATSFQEVHTAQQNICALIAQKVQMQTQMLVKASEAQKDILS